MLREFLPETLVLPRNALGRNGNPELLGKLRSKKELVANVFEAYN